ncbi:MAG TPA: hypothetical protein ENN39_03255 [Desulfonatronum sp.]|nr:hypothetical protein [Desulfonatronum sp.]
MDVSGIGTMAREMNRQTFGAQVVARTLDTMNNAGPSAVPTDKQSFGAAVVSKTMDYMNSEPGKSGMDDMSQTYNFAKDVLGTYAAGRGALADLQV